MMIISNASRPVSPAAPPAAGAGPVAATRCRVTDALQERQQVGNESTLI